MIALDRTAAANGQEREDNKKHHRENVSLAMANRKAPLEGASKHTEVHQLN